MTRRLAALALVLAALAALATSAPADAHEYYVDDRPCVTSHELWFTPGGLSRAQVEHRWEVTGKGTRVTGMFFGAGWIYPMCDVDMADEFAVAQFEPGYGLVEVGDYTTGADRG